MQTMESANVQNQYNLTVIEPSFAIQPWYADNPLNPNQQEETFMVNELVPWVNANLATTGDRAELADRVLEVRNRRTGPDPEASGRVHSGGVVGLPGGNVNLQ